MAPALFIAILGGILPALVWLAFWLLEDRCKPEPKKYIFFCFVAGMLAVIPALIIERAMVPYLSGTNLLLGWAATEEIVKFAAACIAALCWAMYDEPLDAVIYTVTAALGFSALENALFLLTPIQQGDLLRSIITGDLRFIGATLLHTLASATVGVALALAYFKPARVRKMAAIIGLILAIVLHTLFNFFILGSGSDSTFWVFLIIWAGIIGVLFTLERVKRPADFC
ncbi:PrsW family intramembrane metalloprotease [Candidatus Nomurabacteria bacterium]|nr:PrsW family intramembrane metalloprotease [Candidatus Nomurabacteria bacterium]